MSIDDVVFRRFGILAVIACGMLLASGMQLHPIIGDSFRLNLTWHDAFAAELRHGNLYPRWLNLTNGGFGAPTFYFYAPLPFWVSGFFATAMPFSLTAADCIHLSSALALLCSGVAMYRAASRFLSPTVSVIAAVLYMAMPYHFAIDLWWRAALGELWGAVWPPLIVAAIYDIAMSRRWGILTLVLACSGLILSHLPSFLITICGVAGIGLAVIVVDRNPRRTLVVAARCVVGIALASTLTAGYWLPALRTIGLTDIDAIMNGGRFVYSKNFIPLFTPWTLSGRVELLAASMLAAYGLVLVAAKRTGGSSRGPFKVAAWCTACAMFMVTPASNLVWRLLPPLQRVQFPWRFLVIADLGVVVMFACVIDADSARRVRYWLVRCLPLLCLLAGIVAPVLLSPHHSPEDVRILDTLLRTRADALEYRTKWTSESFYKDVRMGTASSPTPGWDVAYAEDNRTRFSTVRNADGSALPSTVTLNRFYYPNLRVEANKNGQQLAVRAEATTGRAVVDVPPGVNALRVETGLLPDELLGWKISALGAIALLMLLTRTLLQRPGDRGTRAATPGAKF